MWPISSTLNNVFMYSLNCPRAEKKLKNLSLNHVSCINFFFLGGWGVELQVIKQGFPSFLVVGRDGVSERESNDPEIITKNSSIELGETMSSIPVI